VPQPLLEVNQQLAVYTALAQGGSFGLVIVDRELRVMEINPALAALNAMPREAHLGRQLAEIIPGFWPDLMPLCQRGLNGAVVLKQEMLGATDGAPQSRKHWLVSIHPVWEQGSVNALAMVVDDVTEQRRTEAALRLRNDLYAMLARTNRTVSRSRSALELYRDLCTITVETGRFPLAWVGVPNDGRVLPMAWAGPGSGYLDALVISLDGDDPRACGPTGHAVRTGQTVVVNDYQAAAMTAPWHALAASYGFAASAAFPLRERGQVVAVLTLYAPVVAFFSDDLLETLGQIVPSVSFALDTLRLEEERRRDEAALRLRDRAMQAVSQGICITDARQPERPLIYVSPGFETLTGYSSREVVGRNCRFLQGPDSSAEVIAEMRTADRAGRECTVELVNYRKDGTTFWNHLTIAPVRDERGTVAQFIAVLTDVTARRRMEEQLRQAQKLEAIGMLAGGIAHDFNNLLTVINGYAALLLSRMSSADSARSSLIEINHAGERAANLTRQLLAYSRRQMLEHEVLNLNDVVRSVESMLVRLIGEDITLSVQTAPELGLVKVDRSQMEQVIINLLVNARDALPGGGAVVISTCDIQHRGTDSGEPAAMPAGDYVVLSVWDDGSGMDEDTRRQVFDPFFTTKEAGQGTGMGLAMVLGIINQSHGYVTIDSAPQKGTTVRIYLPRSVEQPSIPDRTEPMSLQQASATILLVEDEQTLRVLTRHIFEAHGYTVLEAADGRDALDIADAYEGVIDLLVSDVVMPRLNGIDLADELRRRRPGCRCLLLSGYSEHPVLRKGGDAIGYEFLAKPFTPDALARKVYDLVTADT